MQEHQLNMVPIAIHPSVEEIKSRYPCTDTVSQTVNQHRQEIAEIIQGKDDRLLVIIGPCSIHDPKAAWDYAQQLHVLTDKFRDNLKIVMRTYIEKPRTTTGWKGFLNDPFLDNSYQFNAGIKLTRELLLKINNLGLACGVEILNQELSPYYLDLISWASIGARTTESQPHREFASGLPCPIGFKNTTDGNIQTAINAIKCANHKHVVHQKNSAGQMCSFQTPGNNNAHLILRGGKRPNYHSIDRINASTLLANNELNDHIIVDCSHGNSQGDTSNQSKVAKDIATGVASGQAKITGVMIESFLVAGKQTIALLPKLTYGQSITDACIDINQSNNILAMLSEAVNQRRRHLDASKMMHISNNG